MKEVWSLQFVQDRTKESDYITYKYSSENDVNMVETESGLVPLIESGSEVLDLMTKTEQCFESDDDNIMIPFDVAHIA